MAIILLYSEFESEESEFSEAEESEESQESESDKISILFNYYGDDQVQSNSHRNKQKGIDMNQNDLIEEDKNSVTVKAGNKIIERTVEQVISNAKTIQKFKFRHRYQSSGRHERLEGTIFYEFD